MSIDKTSMLQFIRFVIVGVINTLVSLIVIFLCKSVWGINEWVSNLLGYVAGFINSFIWNKLFVFQSHASTLREGVKFLMGFVLCYGIQFVATWVLFNYTWLHDMEFVIMSQTFSGYAVATLLGMCVYTIANFVYNRAVTFKTTHKGGIAKH